MKQTKTSSKDLKDLYETVLKLQNVDECKKFFRDLCTISEINAMVERLKVAKMINDGISYREISKKTGSSTATITRVAHWLRHGKGGYKLIIDRIQ